MRDDLLSTFDAIRRAQEAQQRKLDALSNRLSDTFRQYGERSMGVVLVGPGGGGGGGATFATVRGGGGGSSIRPEVEKSANQSRDAGLPAGFPTSPPSQETSAGLELPRQCSRPPSGLLAALAVLSLLAIGLALRSVGRAPECRPMERSK